MDGCIDKLKSGRSVKGLPPSRIWVALATGFLIFGGLSGVQKVAADPMFDAGILFYKKKDYKKAQAYFAQAIKQNPSDANAIYYHGVTAQALGDKATATRDYAIIVSRFSGSSSYDYATRALSALDPTYCRQLMKANGGGGGSSGGPPGSPPNSSAGGSSGNVRTISSRGGQSAALPSDIASLPNEAVVYFTSSPGSNPLIMIPASINGRPIQMVFDTGAGGVAIGKNHLAEIGVAPPTGSPTGAASGVGSNGTVPVWDMPAVVKVGTITRKLNIMVQDNMGTEPLLGQTFFNAFTYEIDNSAHSIRFKKKGTGSHGGNFGSNDTVPFIRDPRMPTHLIVTAEINNRPMKVIFDTGAQPIAFTFDQLREANIKIPDDAVQAQNQGIGGTTQAFVFPISSIKLGPIYKTNIEINAVKDAAMPMPLLGQTFFGDFKYTIDENNNRIIFRR